MKYFCIICKKEIVTHDGSCYGKDHHYMLVIKNKKVFREKADFIQLNITIYIDYDGYHPSKIHIYGKNIKEFMNGNQYGENDLTFKKEYLENLCLLS